MLRGRSHGEALLITERFTIVPAILAVVGPLSQEELVQVPGINRRVLGRNLTRLCKTGRIEKTADGRYVAHGE